MVADVRRLIKTCKICQVAKPVVTHLPGSRQRLCAGHLWQEIAIELVGPLPKTAKKLDNDANRPFHSLAGHHSPT